MGGWRRNFMQPAPRFQVEMPPEQNEGGKFYDEIERIRNSAGPGISAYRNALNEVPQQEEYAPDKWTRVAAGLSGLSAGMKDAGEGIRVAQGLNSSNYRQAMAEYNNRLGTLQEQADMEREDMNTRMTGLYKARELGLKYDEYQQKRDESLRLDATRTITANAAMKSAEARAAEAAKID
jgi:O-succinylbenzoate synthase